jgi:hypothetical protein
LLVDAPGAVGTTLAVAADEHARRFPQFARADQDPAAIHLLLFSGFAPSQALDLLGHTQL